MEDQRAIYDAKLAEIRLASERRLLEEATEPALGEAAINSMAVLSAINSAS